MIQENAIHFPENLELGEETSFVLECMLCSNSMVILEEKLYYYARRDGSLTKSKYNEKMFEQLNRLYLEKKKVYERYGFNNYPDDLCGYTMNHTLPILISNELKSGKTIGELVNVFKRMREFEMLCEAFRHCSTGVIRSRIRYLVILLKYRLYFIVAVLCSLC